MSSINKVALLGNVVTDPEVRRTNAGDPIVNMRVATSDRWTDKATGERKEKSEYHTVVIFNDRLADVAEKYLSKGSKVYLEGKLQTRKWQDRDNNDRYSTEVVLQRFQGELVLLDKPKGERAPERQPEPADDLEDTIPF